MNIRVVKYHPDFKDQWNSFIETSKNATFLFNRDFMDYHSDRFQDYSLMIFDVNRLLAVLPANRVGAELHSHQGLSYGGFVLAEEIFLEEVTEVLKSTLIFLEKEGIERLHLKLLPTIYHTLPADEMEYLLFILNAKLTRRDSACVIQNDHRLPIRSSNRIRGLKKALKKELQVREVSDYQSFWNEVLIPNLWDTHRSAPVHSLEEIQLLHNRFPNQIRLFNVYDRDQIVAGTVIFDTPRVANVQYISANNQGRNSGALDLLYDHLISFYEDRPYFTFGISNEAQGRKVNKGLLHWKETFGARVIVHSFYEVETKNHLNLNKLFV